MTKARLTEYYGVMLCVTVISPVIILQNINYYHTSCTQLPCNLPLYDGVLNEQVLTPSQLRNTAGILDLTTVTIV